jgi:hypothetical protein
MSCLSNKMRFEAIQRAKCNMAQDVHIQYTIRWLRYPVHNVRIRGSSEQNEFSPCCSNRVTPYCIALQMREPHLLNSTTVSGMVSGQRGAMFRSQLPHKIGRASGITAAFCRSANGKQANPHGPPCIHVAAHAAGLRKSRLVSSLRSFNLPTPFRFDSFDCDWWHRSQLTFHLLWSTKYVHHT